MHIDPFFKETDDSGFAQHAKSGVIQDRNLKNSSKDWIQTLTDSLAVVSTMKLAETLTHQPPLSRFWAHYVRCGTRETEMAK